jgi:Domain of unknown function (DUF4286)
MIIYNVTINIEESLHDQWKEWMLVHHVPAVLATGYFSGARMSRLLIEEEMGGITYSIQYECPSMAQLEAYREKEAPRLMAETEQRFGGKYVAFRTQMEEVGRW